MQSHNGGSRGPSEEVLTPSPSPPDISRKDGEEEVGWEGPADPGNPFNWSKSRKWTVTIFACFITLIVGVNATAITSAAVAIDEAFGVSEESFPNSYWPVTSWNIGAAIVPLVVLPLMENFGIKKAYLGIYLLFTLFIIPQALAQNFATLIVTRIIAGGCAGVLENITGEIICDIWQGATNRSIPMALYIWSLLVGITIGPVIGGGIINHLSWRWISWIQLIFYAGCLPLVALLTRETRGPVLLKQRAKRIRKETGRKVYAQAEKEAESVTALLKEAVTRPTHMLFTEFVVASFTLWSAFCFGIIFLFTQSVAQVYTTLYDWDPYRTGVVQIAIVVGETVGLAASFAQNYFYKISAKRNTDNPGRPIPEARLYLSVLGSFLGLTAGFFIYAWTAYPTLPWIAPTIGLFLVGLGAFTVVSAVTNYLTDSYAKYAASALAAVAFGENTFAAFLPLASLSMYTNLGFHWASSLIGFLGLGLSFVPVVLVVWGKGIRERSPFMGEAMYE